jgi:hypothetical protein
LARVLLEALILSQLLMDFPAYYGAPKVITAFIKEQIPVPIISDTNPVHDAPSHQQTIHFNVSHFNSQASKKCLSLCLLPKNLQARLL